jgi:hypothetical protein
MSRRQTSTKIRIQNYTGAIQPTSLSVLFSDDPVEHVGLPNMLRIGISISKSQNASAISHQDRLKTLWTSSVHTRREAAPTVLEFPFYRLSHQPTTFAMRAILSLFLFGIKELAVQLEEPFSILPMQKFCDEIRDSTQGLIDWSVESRNGRKTKA